MSSPKSMPRHTLEIKTFCGLEQYVKAFADQCLQLLILIGPPGTGKSRAVRELGGDWCWIHGTATAFGIYQAAFEHRDQPIVLDDIDGLHCVASGLRLLKCLCQSEPVKQLSWQTSAAALDRRGIPREFTTRSRILIIANRWESISLDAAAVEDRGHVIQFVPTPLELHRHASTWFWNQEVFDFIADVLHLIEQPSLRLYVRAWELQRAGLDWRGMLLSCCLNGAALEVARLRADPSFDSQEARARAFVKAGFGSRATFFNHARKLVAPEPVPHLILTTKTSPEDRCQDADLLKDLRARFGQMGNG